MSMDRVLGLMRQSSSSTEGRIFKGSQDGTSVGYKIRSCFCLVAIRDPREKIEDKNRITVLQLNRKNKESSKVWREQIKPLAAHIGTEAYASRFRARIITSIPLLRHNAAMLADALGERFESQRLGDQLGPMLAGAFLLKSDLKLDPDSARKAVGLIAGQMDAFREFAGETEEDMLLSALSGRLVRVASDRNTVERSVGELVAIAAGIKADVSVGLQDAKGVLSRHGIKVGSKNVWIANRHSMLEELMSKTPYSVGWSGVLKRHKDAVASHKPMWFAGAVSRAVMLPLGALMAEDGEEE